MDSARTISDKKTMNTQALQGRSRSDGNDGVPNSVLSTMALSSPNSSSPAPSSSTKSLTSAHCCNCTDSTLSSMSLPYQLKYEAGSHGKKLSATKRRIKFHFGFGNPQALKDPQKSGEACRSNCGNEHEVVLVWSIASGKRLVLCNGQEVHFSATPTVSFAMSLASPKLVLPEQKFQHSWEMTTTVVSSSSLGNEGSIQSQTNCHSLTIVAHATPLKGLRSSADSYGIGNTSTSQGGKAFRQFDLLVDGISFFDMPHVFELGLSQRGGGMIPARLRAKQKKHFMIMEAIPRSPPPLSSSIRNARPPRPSPSSSFSNNPNSPAATLRRRSLSMVDYPTFGAPTGLVSSASTSSLMATYSDSLGGRSVPTFAATELGNNITCSRSVTTSFNPEGNGEVEVVSIGSIVSTRSPGMAAESNNESFHTPVRQEKDILFSSKHHNVAPPLTRKKIINQKRHDQNVFIAKETALSVSSGNEEKEREQEEDFLFGESIDEDDFLLSSTTAQNITRIREPSQRRDTISSANTRPRNKGKLASDGIQTVKSWGTEATVETLSPTGVRSGGDDLASPQYLSVHQVYSHGDNGVGSNCAAGHHFHRRSKTLTDDRCFVSPPPYRTSATGTYQRRHPLRDLDPNSGCVGISNPACRTSIRITSHGVAPSSSVPQALPQYDYPAFAALHVSQVSSPPTSRIRKGFDQLKSPSRGGSIHTATEISATSPKLRGIGLC